MCDQLNIDMQERANFVKMRKAQYEDEENENEAKLLEGIHVLLIVWFL